MPVATFDKVIENIRVDQLDIKKGEFKGENLIEALIRAEEKILYDVKQDRYQW